MLAERARIVSTTGTINCFLGAASMTRYAQGWDDRVPRQEVVSQNRLSPSSICMSYPLRGKSDGDPSITPAYCVNDAQ